MVSYNTIWPSFVCKLAHKCEDITKNAWRTPLNAQCNIEYRLQYSLFFTFSNYHRNRLCLYFLVNYRISIISLLLWASIPNPANTVLTESAIVVIIVVVMIVELYWKKGTAVLDRLWLFIERHENMTDHVKIWSRGKIEDRKKAH